MSLNKRLGVYDRTLSTLEGYKFGNSVSMLDGCNNIDYSKHDDDTDEGIALVPLIAVSEGMFFDKTLEVYNCQGRLNIPKRLFSALARRFAGLCPMAGAPRSH